MSKVIVGMSGGVDSAVAALLLKRAGHDVIGVTLRTWESEDAAENRCCEIDDARAVCRTIGIPYYPWNACGTFREMVIDPFVKDYLEGRTPNPCVECNRNVKWGRMLRIADELSADYIATGHYADVIQTPGGRFTVRQSAAGKKDQTYMLWKLTQEQLSRTLMPLASLTKEEVRRIAEEAGLPVAKKHDSQEICFVPDGHYSEFVENEAATACPKEGNFVDEDGKILGRHKGITHYTVGQRRGLGIAAGYHIFVKEIRPETDEIVLSREDALFSNEIFCRDLNFLSVEDIKGDEKISARVRIRYHHQGEEAELTRADDETLRVLFRNPVRAATPGQSAVFYDADGCVIGGGKIAKR